MMGRREARRAAVDAACCNWAAMRVIGPPQAEKAATALLEATERASAAMADQSQRVGVILAAQFATLHRLGGDGASE